MAVCTLLTLGDSSMAASLLRNVGVASVLGSLESLSEPGSLQSLVSLCWSLLGLGVRWAPQTPEPPKPGFLLSHPPLRSCPVQHGPGSPWPEHTAFSAAASGLQLSAARILGPGFTHGSRFPRLRREVGQRPEGTDSSAETPVGQATVTRRT